MKEFDLTQEQVAKRVGQDRSTVANFLRLRTLPKEIRDDIINHTLSMGHARAILGAKNVVQQKAVWRRIVAGRLSVRETEALVKRLASDEGGAKKKKSPTSEALYIQDLAEELSRVLGTKVSIIRKGKSGRVEIAFYNNQDLDRLITCLRRSVS
jgi:ParB family chromosome partitioning protein